MPAAAAGSRANAEFGFESGNTSVIEVGSSTLGFPDGNVDVSLDRQYAYLQLDADLVDQDAVCIKKDMLITLTLGEILQGNLQYCWDNDAAAGGVLTIDDDMGALLDLDINTSPPSNDSNDTREISMPQALPIGNGPYSVPLNAKQRLGGQFKAIANSAALLGTVTDVYNA